jgi:[NiFe] hydrogenase assembly HybE family chaperone
VGERAGAKPLRLHAADPAPLLEAVFRRIQAETMAGVPILNPALTVEAVGFSRWQDHWLGIVITPWFMNLVLVPGAAASWQSVAPGLRLFRKFPSGDFAFLGSDEPEVGEFQSCSLFSPWASSPSRPVPARSPAPRSRRCSARPKPRSRRRPGKPSKTPNRLPSNAR